MKEKKELNRILIDHTIMAGKPVIKGTRLTVQFILGLLAQGVSTEEIINEYDRLSKEDILACLTFAKEIVQDSIFLPLSK